VKIADELNVAKDDSEISPAHFSRIGHSHKEVLEGTRCADKEREHCSFTGFKEIIEIRGNLDNKP